MFARRIPTVPLCALSILMLTVAGCDSGWDVRLATEEGRQYEFAADSDMKTTMDLGPMGAQTMSSRIQVTLGFKAAEVRDDETRFDFHFGDISMENGFGGQSLKYDSTSPDPDSPLYVMNDYIQAVLAADLVYTVNALGEVLTVTGDEKIGSATDYISDPEFAPMAEQLNGWLNNDAFKTMLQQATPTLPGKRVRLGDTWEHSTLVPNSLGEMTVVTTYTLVGEEDHGGLDCLKLDVVQAMELHGESPMLIQMRELAQSTGGSVELEMGVMAGTGNMWLDPSDGMMCGSTIDTTAEANFILKSVPGPTGEPMDMTMKMTLDGKSTVARNG